MRTGRSLGEYCCRSIQYGLNLKNQGMRLLNLGIQEFRLIK
jgi:hypothetical protein